VRSIFNSPLADLEAGQLDVIATTMTLISEIGARHELTGRFHGKIVVDYLGEPEYPETLEDWETAWRQVFLEMRHCLALCSRVGTMTLTFELHGVEHECREGAWQAFQNLSAEEKAISLEDVGKAYEKEYGSIDAERGFFSFMVEMHEHYAKPGETLGMGEIMKRWEADKEEED
jgi:hypothetical protein